MTCSIRSGRITLSRSMPSWCWVLMSTAFSATGLPSSYSNVTWVLPSGRRYGSWPDLRTSARRSARRWAVQIGSGMQVRRLVAGVAEHHPLVAGTLGVDLVLAALAAAQLLAGVDALGDVRALLVDR